MDDVPKQWAQMLESIGDSIRDPAGVHAVLGHIPIGLCAVGLLAVLVLIFTGGRNSHLRWTCFFLYGLGALAAWYSTQFGSLTQEMIEAEVQLTDAARNQLRDHQMMGQWSWLVMLVPAVIVVFTAIPSTVVRTIMLMLALLTGVVSTTYVTVTAYHGTALVHVHGVAPNSANNYPRPLEKRASRTPAAAKRTSSPQNQPVESKPQIAKPDEPEPSKDNDKDTTDDQ